MSYTNIIVNIMRYPLASEVVCAIPGAIIGGLLGKLLTPSDRKDEERSYILVLGLTGVAIGILTGCGISAYIDYNASKLSLLCSAIGVALLYYCGSIPAPQQSDAMEKCILTSYKLALGVIAGTAAELIGSSAYQAVQYCRS